MTISILESKPIAKVNVEPNSNTASYEQNNRSQASEKQILPKVKASEVASNAKANSRKRRLLSRAEVTGSEFRQPSIQIFGKKRSAIELPPLNETVQPRKPVEKRMGDGKMCSRLARLKSRAAIDPTIQQLHQSYCHAANPHTTKSMFSGTSTSTTTNSGRPTAEATHSTIDTPFDRTLSLPVMAIAQVETQKGELLELVPYSDFMDKHSEYISVELLRDKNMGKDFGIIEDRNELQKIVASSAESVLNDLDYSIEDYINRNDNGDLAATQNITKGQAFIYAGATYCGGYAGVAAQLLGHGNDVGKLNDESWDLTPDVEDFSQKHLLGAGPNQQNVLVDLKDGRSEADGNMGMHYGITSVSINDVVPMPDLVILYALKDINAGELLLRRINA